MNIKGSLFTAGAGARRKRTVAFITLAIFVAQMFVLPVDAQRAAVRSSSKRMTSKERREREERTRRSRFKFNAAANAQAQRGPTVVIPMQFLGESESLSELAARKLPPLSKESGPVQEEEAEKLFELNETPLNAESPQNEFVQTETLSPFAPIGGTSFDGPGASGFAPPDTTMAVGPNHIIVWVNAKYQVFNKAGTSLVGPVNGNTLFTGTGNLCETTNRGDPILQYDRLADRWVLSQFAFNVTGSNPSSPYLQCFAVSTTNDPTGTYFRYSATFGSTSPDGFNDYGKLGIWNDAYYTAYNIFGGSPAGSNTGAAMCASDRTKMLAGDASATTLCAPTAVYAGGAAFLPADMDGTSLPTDTTRGGLFMRQSTAPALRFLRLKPNFAAGTVTLTDGFGGATGSFVNFALAATNRPCNGTGGTCVEQPGTTNKLDTLGDRLMYRLAYRNRNGVDSLVVTQSVDPDGAGARSSALRWYEIRNPLGNPSDSDTSKRPFIYQTGTFDPGAVGDRWMGSVATDKFGNMLAGYSLADATNNVKPSVAVSGRSQCDTLNTLQAEIVALAGSGSQTGTLTRWGDYTTMQVDPSDDLTFWFVGQYLAADGTFNWKTRVVSYRFPTTTASVTGDFNTPGNWSNGVPSSTVLGIVPAGRTMTVNAPTTVCSLDVNSGGNVVMNSDLSVTGSLILGNTIDTGSSKLILGCNATVSGASASAYVKGTIKKDYCSTGGFTYPVGTANGFSPVAANVMNLATNPSSLDIKAVQGNRSGMAGSNSLQRYWTLTETGDLTTNLVFNYLDGDVAGTESSYQLYKWNGVTPSAVTPFTLSAAANTMSVNGVTSFSDWAIGNLAPTAAGVSVAGRVVDVSGRGIRLATLTLQGGTLAKPVVATTNSFGYFKFNDIPPGDLYIVSVMAMRYTFAEPVQTISLMDSVAGVSFVGSMTTASPILPTRRPLGQRKYALDQ